MFFCLRYSPPDQSNKRTLTSKCSHSEWLPMYYEIQSLSLYLLVQKSANWKSPWPPSKPRQANRHRMLLQCSLPMKHIFNSMTNNLRYVSSLSLSIPDSIQYATSRPLTLQQTSFVVFCTASRSSNHQSSWTPSPAAIALAANLETPQLAGLPF